MRQYLCSRCILGMALFGLISINVFGANVGYYEMCYSEGRSWAIAPISSAGHTPVYLSDLSAVDLQGLDVLFVTNCFNLGYGAEYINRLPEVAQAVQDGLVLLIHDRTVKDASVILPGGAAIQSVRGAGRDVEIVDATTSVTNGPGGVINSTALDGARNTEHGYFLASTLPAGSRTILSRPDASQSVVTSYEYGKGNVVYSTVPLDYYVGILPVCIRFPVEQQYLACMAIANVYAPNVIHFAVQLRNNKTVASAGIDQSIDENFAVSLDGSASSGHGALTYQWTQLSPASPLILLSNSNSAKPTFTAPAVNMNTSFTLQLVVTDIRGSVSDPDTVDITVKNLNTPPVADAGNDFTIKAGATATLDGSNSYDADGDSPLVYSWSQITGPATTLHNPNAVNSGFAVPNAVGQDLVFELTVSDGMELSLASRVIVSIVDNAVPLANAGVDQTRDEGSIVLLNALGSSDPDKDGLMFDWMQIAGPTVVLDNPGSPTPFFTVPRVAEGGMTMVFTLTVTDMDLLNPKSSVDQVAIHVRNINDPPACNLARPSVASLWPPNHKMRLITIDGVSDVDSVYKNVVIVINNVTMDEPVVGHGSGHSSPDAVIQDMTPNDMALLRAERKKHNNGRVYQVNFTASDGFESCTGNIQVIVPKSRKRGDCDDDNGYEDDHKNDEGRKHRGKDHKRDHEHRSKDHKHNAKGHKHDHENDEGRKHRGKDHKRDHEHRGKDHKHKAKGHKHDHAKRCQVPAAVDDGQIYDASEVRQHRDHDSQDKMDKKLAELKAKREKHKNKKDRKKKNSKEDD